MSKYEHLAARLRWSEQESLPMTFGQAVQSCRHPSISFGHGGRTIPVRPPMLGSMRETANVKMRDRKLIFRKTAPDALPSEIRGGEQAQKGVETAAGAGFLSHVYGALKGTVKIAPNAELASPLDEEWDAAR